MSACVCIIERQREGGRKTSSIFWFTLHTPIARKAVLVSRVGVRDSGLMHHLLPLGCAGAESRNWKSNRDMNADILIWTAGVSAGIPG